MRLVIPQSSEMPSIKGFFPARCRAPHPINKPKYSLVRIRNIILRVDFICVSLPAAPRVVRVVPICWITMSIDWVPVNRDYWHTHWRHIDRSNWHYLYRRDIHRRWAVHRRRAIHRRIIHRRRAVHRRRAINWGRIVPVTKP